MKEQPLQNIIDITTFEGLLNIPWYRQHPQFIMHELYTLRDSVARDLSVVVQNSQSFSQLCQKIIPYLEHHALPIKSRYAYYSNGGAVSFMDELIEDALVHLKEQTGASEHVLRRPF